MSERTVRFQHDGHQFVALEEVRGGAGTPEAEMHWLVRMDDADVLEFRGEFPYRDEDVRKRVVEWYEIQRPR